MGPCFDSRHKQRRPDSPHPKSARRVTFKLPAEVPTDRWLQVRNDKGKDKWRSAERNARHAVTYRRQFNTQKREEVRLENYKGRNPMSRSQWCRQQRIRKAEREAMANKGDTSTKIQGESSTNKPKNQTEEKPIKSRFIFGL